MHTYWFRYRMNKDGNDLQISVHAGSHAHAYKVFAEKVDTSKVYEYELLDSVFEQMTAA